MSAEPSFDVFAGAHVLRGGEELGGGAVLQHLAEEKEGGPLADTRRVLGVVGDQDV